MYIMLYIYKESNNIEDNACKGIKHSTFLSSLSFCFLFAICREVLIVWITEDGENAGCDYLPAASSQPACLPLSAKWLISAKGHSGNWVR